MTNLTVRPDAGPSRCPQPPTLPPRITTAKTPALLAAASSASTRSRNGAVTGMDGQAEPSPDAATAATGTPSHAIAIAMARRCQAGRRPADPVNEIVTSKTAACI